MTLDYVMCFGYTSNHEKKSNLPAVIATLSAVFHSNLICFTFERCRLPRDGSSPYLPDNRIEKIFLTKSKKEESFSLES